MLKSRNNRKSKQEKKSHEGKYLGVTRRPWRRYAAKIRNPFTKERHWLGTFDTAEEAALAYDVVVRSISGSLAKTNFFSTEIISSQRQPPPQQLLQSSLDKDFVSPTILSLGYSSFCFLEDQPPGNHCFVSTPISSCLQEQHFLANHTNSLPHCYDDYDHVGQSKEISLPTFPNDMSSSLFGYQDNTGEQGDAGQMKISDSHCLEYIYTENSLQGFLKDVNEDPFQVIGSSSSFISKWLYHLSIYCTVDSFASLVSC